MAENTNAPAGWFEYDYPLKEVAGAPVPSRANYTTENCSWLHEMFAAALGVGPWDLKLVYENNNPNADDRITVPYSGSGNYDAHVEKHKHKSDEMLRYEMYAKRSLILRKYEQLSPAKIAYFKDPN